MILVRPSKPYEVFLMRRHSKSSFMPDAFVFPGGAVDDDDRAVVAAGRVVGDPGTAQREFLAAAVRETFEESGVLLASTAVDRAPVSPGHAELAALRNELSAGSRFSGVLARHDWVVDASRLTYYSNWITPPSEPKRFDTHFFIARAPADQNAAADATEVYDGVWLTPRDALGRSGEGSITIVYPTRKHLERLEAFEEVDALFEAAKRRNVIPFRPFDAGDGTVTFEFDQDAW